MKNNLSLIAFTVVINKQCTLSSAFVVEPKNSISFCFQRKSTNNIKPTFELGLSNYLDGLQRGGPQIPEEPQRPEQIVDPACTGFPEAAEIYDDSYAVETSQQQNEVFDYQPEIVAEVQPNVVADRFTDNQYFGSYSASRQQAEDDERFSKKVKTNEITTSSGYLDFYSAGRRASKVLVPQTGKSVVAAPESSFGSNKYSQPFDSLESCYSPTTASSGNRISVVNTSDPLTAAAAATSPLEATTRNLLNTNKPQTSASVAAAAESSYIRSDSNEKPFDSLESSYSPTTPSTGNRISFTKTGNYGAAAAPPQTSASVAAAAAKSVFSSTSAPFDSLETSYSPTTANSENRLSGSSKGNRHAAASSAAVESPFSPTKTPFDSLETSYTPTTASSGTRISTPQKSTTAASSAETSRKPFNPFCTPKGASGITTPQKSVSVAPADAKSTPFDSLESSYAPTTANSQNRFSGVTQGNRHTAARAAVESPFSPTRNPFDSLETSYSPTTASSGDRLPAKNTSDPHAAAVASTSPLRPSIRRDVDSVKSSYTPKSTSPEIRTPIPQRSANSAAAGAETSRKPFNPFSSFKGASGTTAPQTSASVAATASKSAFSSTSAPFDSLETSYSPTTANSENRLSGISKSNRHATAAAVESAFSSTRTPFDSLETSYTPTTASSGGRLPAMNKSNPHAAAAAAASTSPLRPSDRSEFDSLGTSYTPKGSSPATSISTPQKSAFVAAAAESSRKPFNPFSSPKGASGMTTPQTSASVAAGTNSPFSPTRTPFDSLESSYSPTTASSGDRLPAINTSDPHAAAVASASPLRPSIRREFDSVFSSYTPKGASSDRISVPQTSENVAAAAAAEPMRKPFNPFSSPKGSSEISAPQTKASAAVTPKSSYTSKPFDSLQTSYTPTTASSGNRLSGLKSRDPYATSSASTSPFRPSIRTKMGNPPPNASFDPSFGATSGKPFDSVESSFCPSASTSSGRKTFLRRGQETAQPSAVAWSMKAGADMMVVKDE